MALIDLHETAKSFANRAASKVVVAYASFAALWILLSDQLVAAIFTDPQSILWVSMIKGWVFVAVTTALLGILVRRYLKALVDANSRLEASEMRWKFAVEGTGDGLWDWNLQTGEAFYSQRYKEMLGYSDTEIGNSAAEWSGRIHPDDAPSVTAVMQPVLEGSANTVTVEFRMRHKNGHWLWTLGRGMLLGRDADGKPQRMIGTNTDISERKRVEEALKRNQAMMQRTERIAQLGSWEWDVATGSVIWSDELYRIFQRDPALGPPDYAEQLKLYLPEDSQRLGAAVEAAMTAGMPYELELHALRRDGEMRVCLASGYPEFDAQQRVTRLYGSLQDITERKQAERFVEQYRDVIKASMDGFWITDTAGRIIDVNPAICQILGYPREELLTLSIGNIEADETPDETAQRTLEIVERGYTQFEARHRRKDGQIIDVEVSVLHLADLGDRLFAFVRNITERKIAEDRINNLAFYDPLTGLPNRRLLLDRLEQALVSSERRRRHGALMLIDLDNFKTLNDTQGHDMGDQLLVEVATRLKSSIREVDTVARFGGDEFVIILEDLDESVMAAMQAESVAVKILSLMVDPFMLRSNVEGDDLARRSHHCTASIGITLFRDQPQTTDDLMKRADTAMYQAKAAGRNTLRFFDPQMQADVSARAALEVDLRKAIVENQFVLFYQAQVDTRGKVIGAEALVRWQHPQLGLIPPADFIPLAEETGLILPIGHWVLETACVQLKTWESSADRKDLTLAVNVSARQFRMPNIVEQILAVVDHVGIRSDRLKLEMTESLLLENPDEIVAKMNTLKARGISFSLDDFGTGYSSLSYLKRLPLDQLKIDQSFVRDVLIDANDATIARTIVALANSLGLAVIAEGVENSGQRDFLAEAGCPTYQGYFFSRPLSLQEFEAFLLKP